MSSFEMAWNIGGDLFSVPGWKGASWATGVKDSGGLDLALLVADRPMNCAGVFTQNACAAPPVWVSRGRLMERPQARSIAINSGNANALTGAQGKRDAEAMVAALEAHCGGPGLVLSTGVIAVPLPRQKVLEGIAQASQRLSVSEHRVPEAILTTDTCQKTAALELRERGSQGRWQIGGIAKGSGMIHPNMATMLAVVATDIPVAPPALHEALKRAVDASFHQISVDGDTSTNDAVLVLAPEPPKGEHQGPPQQVFQDALTKVCQALAQQIIGDGEGASRWMRIHVTGAAEAHHAHKVAEAVARSPLVKTALAGGSTNWGRILSAVGNAGVTLHLPSLTLSIDGQRVFAQGTPQDVDPQRLQSACQARHVDVHIDLAMGPRQAAMTTTDLTHRYVEINADYVT